MLLEAKALNAPVGGRGRGAYGSQATQPWCCLKDEATLQSPVKQCPVGCRKFL